jgi:hypothetical protein
MLDDSQPITSSLKVVALARDHFALGLARLLSKRFLLASDPSQLGNDSQTNYLVIDKHGYCNPHPTGRRIHAQVQVFDSLSHYFYSKAANLQVMSLSTHAGSSTT